jgi:hypothetical protein
MSAFETLTVPALEDLTIDVAPPGTVRLAGTLAVPDPAAQVGGFFRSVHAAAVEDKLAELTLDVRKLTFVNSSSIRLFVDWITWLRKEPEAQRYHLKFLISRHVTWQRTSVSTLVSLARNVVSTETGD